MPKFGFFFFFFFLHIMILQGSLICPPSIFFSPDPQKLPKMAYSSLRRHNFSECPSRSLGSYRVPFLRITCHKIRLLYEQTNFAFYGVKIQHEMTKNWSLYGDGRLVSAPQKILGYWRMPPSFFSRKIDHFKKKVCPNRTTESKVTTF